MIQISKSLMSWASIIDDLTLEQARTTATLPFIFPHDPDLAYLVEGTPEFDLYISELHRAQRFAALNRDEMMDRMISALQHWIGVEVQVSENIDCHHNYSAVEEHFGKRVWVSRKGAIHAGVGVAGLFPGSMVGIEYRDSDAFIDEIPGAYKPIEQVMADAGDLVKVVHELHQLVNVKGN